jgi:predicted nucleotidyltransferase
MLTIKDNNYLVMGLFFDNPEKKFHIRQISRLLGLSPPGILKIVKRLKKEGLLVSEKKGMIEEVSASKTDRFFCSKLCHNLSTLNESGLVDFLKDKYEEPEAIVVFGSYARAEDTSTSDVDIAVVTGLRLSIDFKKFEKRVNRKINLYEVSMNECRKEFINNLANGIVLHGFLKAVI